MTKNTRIVLEPALEEFACEWSPAKRRAVARMYARWARQLRVTAKAMETQAGAPLKRKRLTNRQAAWN
jgi:protein subunit release factor B